MNGTNSSSSFSCPSPLVAAADGALGIGGSPCLLPYRSVLWSPWEWAEGDRLALGCTIASFISLCVIMLTWSVFPSKRRQHHLLMFMACQFIVSLVFIVSLASTDNSPSGIGLPSADSPVPESSRVCVFQSALLVFFVNAAVSWWTAIALTLFLKTVLHLRLNKQQQSRMTAAYHLSSWSVSLGLTVTAAACGWLGRSSVVPWCFFRDDAPAAADWALFYIPIGVRGVAGMAMMAAVMWRLRRQSALMASMRRRRSGWVRNMRPLLFCLQFLVIFLVLITFRAVLYFHQSQYAEATAQFVSCLLDSASSADCGERPVGGPPVALFFLIIIASCGQGVVPGLIYLSQRDTLQLWHALLSGQGVDGVSRTTRGAGGESSVNTTSRVGGGAVSTNSRVGRKMSAKAPPPVPGSGDTAKAKAAAAAAAARKGSFSLPSNAATTVRASPSPAHSGLVVNTGDDSGQRGQAASLPNSNYAGLRISRAEPPSALSLAAAGNEASPPPSFSPTVEYSYDSPYDSAAFSIQMASIRPALYDSLPQSVPRTEWAPDSRQAAVVQPPVVVTEGINNSWSGGEELAAVNAAAYADDDCSAAMAGVSIEGAAAEEEQKGEEDYRVSLPTDD